ncbi:MAG: hypothetical protein WBE20_06230 [Candidatus Acidiferrales bacterium]
MMIRTWIADGRDATAQEERRMSVVHGAAEPRVSPDGAQIPVAIFGKITPGKRADLIVVVKDGRIVFRK